MIENIPQKFLKKAAIHSDIDSFINKISENICYLEINSLAGDMPIKVMETKNVKRLVLVSDFSSIDLNESKYLKSRWNNSADNYSFVSNRFKYINNTKIYKKSFDDFINLYNGKFNFIFINKKDLNNVDMVTKCFLLLENDGIIGSDDYNLIANFLINDIGYYISDIIINGDRIQSLYLKKNKSYSFINN